MDQRGSGKSTPTACLEDNNTWALVDDIEKVRSLVARAHDEPTCRLDCLMGLVNNSVSIGVPSLVHFRTRKINCVTHVACDLGRLPREGAHTTSRGSHFRGRFIVRLRCCSALLGPPSGWQNGVAGTVSSASS